MQSATNASSVSRVLIVDDHPIVCQALKSLIDLQPDLQVCGTATSHADGLRAARETSPHAAIVDISLTGAGPVDRSGLALLDDLMHLDPPVPSLVLSMYDESLYALRVLRAGGRGYMMKHQVHGKVIEALRRVLDDEIYLSPAMRERLPNVHTARAGRKLSKFPGLSDRELEILGLIGSGYGNTEIAERLDISIKTVEAHKENIKSKLKLKDANELVHCAAHHVIERGSQTLTD